MTTRRKRWLIGSGGVLLVLLLAAGWYVHQVSAVFRMSSEVYQKTASPDGRYVATLFYRDGLTFGYYFVTLQPTGEWHHLQPGDAMPQDEVAEIAAEGLKAVTWKGSHVLVIDYEKSGTDQAEFVLQKKAWRDVRIAYHGS